MNSSITPSPARRCAVEILAEILDRKRPFDEAVSRHGALRALSERDRNFARLMVMTALRRTGQIDALLARMLEKPLSGKTRMIMHCLRLGVVQLVWLKTPPHAAVSTMVDTAAELGHESMKGLVNAVLKRAAREADAILAAQDAARLSAPDWLFASWRKAYGEQVARTIAAPGEIAPPLDITVKRDAEAWAETLGGSLLPTGSVRLREAGRVDVLPGYAEGEWWVQDAASALPVALLGDIHGKNVLELCAAPGGKTAQLASRGATVTAVDKSARRLQVLQENMGRLKLQVECVEADILRWKPAVAPDIVLLDAPCSATGTLRRHPEVVWHRRQEDIAELAALQKKMLNRAARWLKEGGRLLYCVCSLQPEEGEAQAEHFLKGHADFSVLPVSGIPGEFINAQGALRTTPAHWESRGGMDGFYAVLLEKNRSDTRGVSGVAGCY
jgi:16S rRNA (cytosine967-C5)-methyltransferase